jgi:hypothetical protein
MWKIVNLVFWVTLLSFALAGSCIIGLNLVLAPMAIALGLAIGTAARRAASWTCPRCDSEMAEPVRVDRQPAGVIRPHAPAWV